MELLGYNQLLLYAPISILYCYTMTKAVGKSNGVLELHIFQNQVEVIAKAVLAASMDSLCSRLQWMMKNIYGEEGTYSIVSL